MKAAVSQAPLSVHAPPAPGLPSCVLLLPLGDLDPSSRVGRSEGAKRRPALAVTQGTRWAWWRVVACSWSQ